MAHDIFLSYSAKDKPVADALCATLENEHIRCWIASRDILPGMDWGGSIIDAIDRSRVMVLVFSSNSNQSEQVKREVQNAAAIGIPILPVRIDDVTPTSTMRYFLGTRHWLDALTPPLEKHLHHLSETVKLLLSQTNESEIQALPDAQEEQEAEKISQVRKSAITAKAESETAEQSASDEKRTMLIKFTNTTMKLVRIPSGKFTMGLPMSESGRDKKDGAQRIVKITKPFYMGIYEVTQEQYQEIMGKNPSNFKGAKNPVEKVSWNEAVAFCEALSKKAGPSKGLPAGMTVRLPSEAEWEYACHAGTTTRFSFGDSDTKLDEFAWYTSNSESKTHPVGQKKCNAWGLYDMYGNVWEWCSDWFNDSSANADTLDPKGPNSGSYRVLRGGSWSYSPWICRSAFRSRDNPDNRYNNIGFRIVIVSSPD